jgi:hypothetical protein
VLAIGAVAKLKLSRKCDSSTRWNRIGGVWTHLPRTNILAWPERAHAF